MKRSRAPLNVRRSTFSVNYVDKIDTEIAGGDQTVYQSINILKEKPGNSLKNRNKGKILPSLDFNFEKDLGTIISFIVFCTF